MRKVEEQGSGLILGRPPRRRSETWIRAKITFFETFRNLMNNGDALLLDVPLAGPGWSTELRAPPTGKRLLRAAFRNFLAGGRAKHRCSGEGKSAESETLPFDQAVCFTHMHEPDTGAESITVSEQSSGRRLLTFRRYRWDSILEVVQRSRTAGQIREVVTDFPPTTNSVWV